MERSFQQHYSQGLTPSSSSSSSASSLSAAVEDFSFLLTLQHDENNSVTPSSLNSNQNQNPNIKQDNNIMSCAGGVSMYNNNTNNNNVNVSSNNILGPPPAKSRKLCSDESGDEEDGSLCLICFAAYESSGDHRCASLRCGHIFGLRCISSWISKKGTQENQAATCPQCSATAVMDDIRVLYTRQIKAIDTSERDRVLRELELAQNSKYQAELEIEMLKILTQAKDEEIRRLKEQVMVQQKQQQQQSNGQTHQQQQPPPQLPDTCQQQAAGFSANNSLMIGNYPVPVPSTHPTRERTVIWSGPLEWYDKTKGSSEGQKILRSIPCQVSANVLNGVPDVKADGWPSKLIMQLIPKGVVGSLGGGYFREVKTVLFMLQACDALTNLTRVMDSGFAACVHIIGNPSCTTKVMILLYSKDRHAYLGFIPNDQAGFVDRIRKVIQQQKIQQGLVRQPGTSTSGTSNSGNTASTSASSSSSSSSIVNVNTTTSSSVSSINEYSPNLPNFYNHRPAPPPPTLQQPQPMQHLQIQLQSQQSRQRSQQMQQQQPQLQMQHQSERMVELERLRQRMKMQALQKTLQNSAQVQASEHQRQQNLWSTATTTTTTTYPSPISTNNFLNINNNNNSNFTPTSAINFNGIAYPQYSHQQQNTNQVSTPEIVLLD